MSSLYYATVFSDFNHTHVIQEAELVSLDGQRFGRLHQMLIPSDECHPTMGDARRWVASRLEVAGQRLIEQAATLRQEAGDA